MTKIPNILIDVNRDNLLSEQSKTLLKDYYMLPHETSPQECFARAALAYCYDDFSLAQRIYDYVSNGWFMFSSPILSNAPKYGEQPKALPISCYLNLVEDTLHDIISHSTETRWLSVKGGGVGGHWSKVRSHSSKSPGIIPFLHTVDSDMVAYTQASTRKGSYAAYLDVNNSDIMEFINMRTPSGGDINRKNLNLHHGINITDDFMNDVKEDNDFNLICPHSKDVRETVSARKLWQKILETRYRTGEPYLHFIDTANRAMPQTLKDKGLRINGSNLCVAPETLILTKEYGYKQISSLENQDVHVWNGIEWSLTTVRQTSENSELIKVTFDDDSYIDCTKEHKFYVSNKEVLLSYPSQEKITQVNAINLRKGDKLEKWVTPEGIEQTNTVKSVEITNRFDKTYCFTEPKRNRGMFNGVLLGQCIEIHLPTTSERTAVCCLSSLNIELYDEWKDTNIVEDLITFLDNVLQYFIDNAPDELSKAKYSASMERSLGLGAMGFHAYLQKKMIPFTHIDAKNANDEIFSNIKNKALKQSLKLGTERGEAPDMVGTGMRNAFLLAIAPNANSSMISGTTPSIEPMNANAFTHRSRVGSHLIKNKILENLLEKHGKNTEEVWKTIILDNGSVRTLDFLSDREKEVFKTFKEINPMDIILLASDRQKYLCQGQSINLYFPSKCDKKILNEVHYKAWESGCKGLYYLRTEASNKVDKLSEKVERNSLKDHGTDNDNNECKACEG